VYVTDDPISQADPSGLNVYDCTWYGNCYLPGTGATGGYGGDIGSTSWGLQFAGLLWTQEGQDEQQYLAYMSTVTMIVQGSLVAQRALSANNGANPCADLFSLPAGLTPASILSQINIVYQNLEDTGTYAEEFNPTDPDNPDPGHYSIVFNDQVANPNIQGGQNEAANTVIHEMIHVAIGMGYAQAAVNLGWENNDGVGGAVGEAAQEMNDQIVRQNCLPSTSTTSTGPNP
jgi:hypothetical protein